MDVVRTPNVSRGSEGGNPHVCKSFGDHALLVGHGWDQVSQDLLISWLICRHIIFSVYFIQSIRSGRCIDGPLEFVL